MQNVKSYKPDKKVARQAPRGFLGLTKTKKKTNDFSIKSDPKVVVKSLFYAGTTALLIFAILFSAYKIIRWQAESDITNETIAKLQDQTTITTIDENTNVSKVDDSIELSPSDYRYLAFNLIDADLDDLKETNQNTRGWIYVPGTNINYPFVQTNNNDFYLTHTFDGHWSDAGWVFLDYRNTATLSDRNQIIYAHGRVDGSMFGSLQNVLTEEWQSNPDNHVVKITTEKNSSLWRVFSVYRIPKTNDYMTTTFNNDTHFLEFANEMKDRSAFNFNTNITEKDRILTLSTCIGTNDRAVLHAKLIKLVEK